MLEIIFLILVSGYFIISAVLVIGAKKPFLRLSNEQLWLPDTEYGHFLLAQMLGFPGSSRDDAVDMTGLMALAVDHTHPGIVGKSAAPKPKPDRDDRIFQDDGESSWRM